MIIKDNLLKVEKAITKSCLSNASPAAGGCLAGGTDALSPRPVVEGFVMQEPPRAEPVPVPDHGDQAGRQTLPRHSSAIPSESETSIEGMRAGSCPPGAAHRGSRCPGHGDARPGLLPRLLPSLSWSRQADKQNIIIFFNC